MSKHIGVIATPTLAPNDPGFQSEDDRINAGQLRGASVQFLNALTQERPRAAAATAIKNSDHGLRAPGRFDGTPIFSRWVG